MKISYFWGQHRGGTYRYIKNLVGSMRELGVETTFDAFPPAFLHGYIPPFIESELKKKREDADIFHCGSDGGFALKLKSKPLVVTVFHLVFNSHYRRYTTFTQRMYHSLYKNYLKKSLQVADEIVAISKSVSWDLQRLFGVNNAKVIYPGIDTNLFRPRKINNSPNIVKLFFVGNLIKRKGIDLLPQIMGRLGNKFRLFYISPSGEMKFSQTNMTPLDYLSKEALVKMYNQCDIFFFPSRLEGFGYGVAEAMSCQKPVVCTNCSSLPELIVNGKGGFLCEMENVDDFVEKIKILAADKNLREEMGKFNRKRVLEKFTLKRMAKEYLKLYQQLIKER